MKTQPRPLPPGARLAAAACLFALASAPLPAQTAAPVTPENAEIVTLPDFTVTSSGASEYMSAESTTGTRVASRIQELPFAVNVVTADFMDDFNTTEWTEALGFVSNVGASEVQSPGYTLRGFEADVQLRNGFRRIGLIDKVSVERQEVIKGPAASIYGTVLPGGIVNVVTRKPQAAPEHKLRVTAGSYDQRRAEISSTGPAGASERVFYRVDLAADSRAFETGFKERHQRTAGLQFLFKLGPATSLLLEGEYLERDEPGNTTQTIPFLIESVRNPWRGSGNFNRLVGLADELHDFNTQGPKTYSDRWVKNLAATFEHRLNTDWSLRVGANWFDRALERVEVGSRNQFNPTTRRVQRGTARLRLFPEGGQGLQADLLGTLETGSVKHRLLLTFDYQRRTEDPSQYDAATNNPFPTDVAAGLSVGAPNYNFVTYYEDPSLYTLASASSGQTDIYGLFLSERLSLLQDRLFVLAGVRVDWAENRNRDLRGGSPEVVSKTDEVTYQLGANLRIAPGTFLYANHSTTFQPPFSVGLRADGSTFVLPNEEGVGGEVGLKVSVREGRLAFTTGYFDIERRNIGRATFDAATGNPITVLSGKERAKGYELDFNWVATSELQFFGNYGYTDAYVAEHEQIRWMEDMPLRRAPKHTFGLGAKYEFKQGALRGLFATAGVKYFDRSLVNPGSGTNITSVTAANPFINLPFPNGRLPFPQFPAGATLTSIPYAVSVPNGGEAVFNDAYTIAEAGLGYKWRTGAHRHRVQVNLKNLADEVYTYGSSAPGDGFNFTVTYDLTF